MSSERIPEKYGRPVKSAINQLSMDPSPYKGQPRYVKLAYLEYTAYVEVIIYS